MANKASNFSHLIQRVAANCLLHPLAPTRHASDDATSESEDDDPHSYYSEERGSSLEHWKENPEGDGRNDERLLEMETLMSRVFDSVSGMKRAYVTLQEAHCPWDAEKMRIADSAVVAELRRLGNLREEFNRRKRRTGAEPGNGRNELAMAVRDVVAPYEAAVEDLKLEVKARDAEVENLREKVRSLSAADGGRKQRRSLSRRLSCSTQLCQVGGAATPEMFAMAMSQVKEASKSFTLLLLSLMKSAQWDISAAVRSIEAAFTNTSLTSSATTTTISHPKYALESYISHKIFQGFDHETFYMDGSLSSLLKPDQFRKECFTQFLDMKAMDPVELLGVLPTCQFGNFCLKKYVSIVHPKMEESLFGNLEHHKQVSAGNHPRSPYYGEFLTLAKSIWLLHLLAFSLDPKPSQFEATRGAEFHPQYMESVLKYSGERVPEGQVVAFPVSPGFKLGNRFVIKARVYPVSRT
uniref:DUF641 domain-containing protein n=1 Tax=Kalanchoe fedtschenkoi TaxID=63787 RepID=A0A7N0TJ78_KALFE